jgi:hypothetical protein
MNAQPKDYGLSHEDLQLLLGVLAPSSGGKTSWGIHEFSWGKQKSIGGDGITIRIDYDNYITKRLGQKYENYLTLHDGWPFVITEIKKLKPGQFALQLVSVENTPHDKPKDAGIITLTYLDNMHALLDSSNSAFPGLEYRGLLWKCAGPTIKEKSANLPDAKLQ